VGAEADDGHLTDGFAEELTNRLARFGELRVVSRRSAFQFKGKPYDIQQIAGQLRVGTVLEGSLRENRDRIEVTAELVSTRDGYYIWSDRYETSLQGLDATEDEIVIGILRALRVTPRGGLEAVRRRTPKHIVCSWRVASIGASARTKRCSGPSRFMKRRLKSIRAMRKQKLDSLNATA
jgi:TolB-like protein